MFSGKLYPIRQVLWNNTCWVWSEEGLFFPVRLTEALSFYLCSSAVLSSGCCLSLSMKAYVSLNDFCCSISQECALAFPPPYRTSGNLFCLRHDSLHCWDSGKNWDPFAFMKNIKLKGSQRARWNGAESC